MKIQFLDQLSDSELQKILTRGGVASAEVKKTVTEILKKVEKEGVGAVLEYTKKFDGVDFENLEVPETEIEAVDLSDYEFLREAAESIEQFHSAQLTHLKAEPKVETRPGITVWREWRPIERVGLYVPGGKATYPSSVLMQAIPARLAGCREIILATPPDREGNVPEVVLAAAKIAGVTKILKCGGAQAIAALYFVYGAEKLFGPGNPYVTEAKVQLSARVAIDMPAGPSEILILADETGNPKFIAADLLSQAEHAEDSSALLVTTSEKLAEAVTGKLGIQLTKLSRHTIAKKALETNGRILIAEDLESAVKFVNAYAPEHLEIVTKDDPRWLRQIMNAGSVFLGPYSAEPAGDFATGSNHVLPTAGFARNFPALSVNSFGKQIQIQHVTKDGLEKIQKTCEKFGQLEGLDAHAKSVAIRFD